MQKIKLQLIFPTLLLCVLAAAAGCITGALTAGFGRVLLWIGTFRTEHLISCVPFLPIAGVCMVWIYQKYGRESSQGMSLIFDAADGTAKRIPLRLIPLLIGSTWLTHLCGGSAGREGVAVQLGAAVSHNIGSRIPWFRSIPDAVPILTIAGMAAGFCISHARYTATAQNNSTNSSRSTARRFFSFRIALSSQGKYAPLCRVHAKKNTPYSISAWCTVDVEASDYSVSGW